LKKLQHHLTKFLQEMKIAIWTEVTWALGRIALAIKRFSNAEVTVYNFQNGQTNEDLFLRDYHEFDFVMGNSYIIPFYEEHFKQSVPAQLAAKLVVTSHFPVFNMKHFCEPLVFREGVHYSGVSKETCKNMNAHLGIGNARWLPFGVDTDFFPETYAPEGPIKRIGYVGARQEDRESEYFRNKGQGMFEEICKRIGAEPVFIHGKTSTFALYEDIDLLICCSELEGGPLGIFEAAASGVPVLTRPVGNVQEIQGIATFNTVKQALDQIRRWNSDLPSLVAYRQRITAEVRERWNMKYLIQTHLDPYLEEIYKPAPIEEPDFPNVQPNGIRLHILGLPHTITTNAFSHCAFTGKVLRFSPMMRSRGFEVFHYGVETSESRADKQIDLLSLGEWRDLRVKSLKALHPELSMEECDRQVNDHKSFIGDLANAGAPVYHEFNRRLRPQILKNYRSPRTDIICLPFGKAHDPALEGLDYVYVESGIGYPDSERGFRIFESNAWMHHELAKAGKQCQNYWFVVPNYYNVLEWPLRLDPEPRTIGFFGRLTPLKGVAIVAEVAKYFPDVKFILCGQGDASSWLTSKNIVYKPPLQGDERGTYLGSLTALMAPTDFIEPFCGVAVEAQLCGTPVLTPNCGAQTETVEQGKTGLRCQTLADYCLGVRIALEGKFDREYIAQRARSKWDMYEVAKEYEYAFKVINDVYNPQNGWYSPVSHIQIPLRNEESTFMDFVEVGVPESGAEANIADLNTFGLTVDASAAVLALLPQHQHCRIKEKAISYYDGYGYIFAVSSASVQEHSLPDWVASCIGIGAANPKVLSELTSRGLDLSLVEEHRIAVQPLFDLLLEEGITGIKHLKLATGESDAKILGKFFEQVVGSSKASLLPQQITMNTGPNSAAFELDQVVQTAKQKFDYMIVSRGEKTVLRKA
jgi:glycosyltransferase involved in cell wall biosynthesis